MIGSVLVNKGRMLKRMMLIDVLEVILAVRILLKIAGLEAYCNPRITYKVVSTFNFVDLKTKRTRRNG